MVNMERVKIERRRREQASEEDQFALSRVEARDVEESPQLPTCHTAFSAPAQKRSQEIFSFVRFLESG